MMNETIYKDEVVKLNDIENLRKLAGMLDVFNSIDFDEMAKLADIELTRRAWCLYGYADSNNYLLTSIEMIKKSIASLRHGTDAELLNKLQAEHDVAV